MKLKILIIACLCFFTFCAKEKDNQDSAKEEKQRCVNCGMYTSMYQKWEAIVKIKDKDNLHFCAPRCMFKVLLDTSATPENIESIMVKDYYDLNLIDAQKAYYVLGSDVLGPMGNDLIPFKNSTSAEQFFKEHKGSKILQFDEVTMETIKSLMKKMEM